MLQKILQAILSRYFGQYITGFESVQLAFWTGRIHIQKASLKHEAINDLMQLHNIPLSIKYSYIGSLQADIPWKNLSSSPVEVKLSEVYIVFNLHALTQTIMSGQPKIALLKSYCDHFLNKSKQMKENAPTPYLQKLLLKILSNLNLKISNISIRVQSGNSNIQESFYSFDSESEKDSEEQHQKSFSSSIRGEKPFAFGFCIQNLESYTINERNEKKYIEVDDAFTAVRKMIEINQISIYLEQVAQKNLFSHNEQSKHQIMMQLIQRKDYRLMSIDGTVLLQKNCNEFDLFFSSNITCLEVVITNDQIRQIIKIIQKFEDVQTKIKVKKMKELSQKEQMELEVYFKQEFQSMIEGNFKNLTEKQLIMIRKLSKKRILQWSKEGIIQMLKKKRVEEMEKQINKKGWLSFLKKNTQIKVDENDLELVEKEVKDLVAAGQVNKKFKFGVKLQFQEIMVQIKHRKISQVMVLLCRKLKVVYGQDNIWKKTEISILDFCLQYKLSKQNFSISCKILQKNEEEQFLKIQNEVSSDEYKMNIKMTSFTINHQIKVLSFIRDLMRIKEKQELNSNINLMRSNIAAEPSTDQSNFNLINYNITLSIKPIKFLIEISDQSFIIISLNSVSLNNNNQNHQHRGNISSLSIIYEKLVGGQMQRQYILEDLKIQVQLIKGLKQLNSHIQYLSLIICEDDFIEIYNCVVNQYKILDIKKKELSNELNQETIYFQCSVTLLDIFKNSNQYQCRLTEDSLLLYSDKDYSKLRMSLSLSNCSLLRIGEKQFKLVSNNMSQILQCEDSSKYQKLCWQIEQRIFQCSSKATLYNLVDKNALNHIKSVYEIEICFRIESVSLKYNIRKTQPFLKLQIERLMIILKEDSFIFRRTLHLNRVQVVNCTEKSDSKYNHIISTFSQMKNHPIAINIEGKKKIHPQYIGQLTISFQLDYLMINYNAETIYSVIHKIAWTKKIPPYSRHQRDLKPLQYIQQFLQSERFAQQEAKRQNSLDLSNDPTQYIEIQQFRKGHSCLVLFHVTASIDKIAINLINGRTLTKVTSLYVQSLTVRVDKGASFLFGKVLAEYIRLEDTSGYPKTRDHRQEGEALVLIQTQAEKNRKKKSIQVQFSRFPIQHFLNKSSIRGFVRMSFNNLVVNYQQQPVMRFIDFLTNQIIDFLMDPQNLHRYDPPSRGPFTYSQDIFTNEQVIKSIEQYLHPYFMSLIIKGENLKCNFCSHPGLEMIPISIDSFQIQSMPLVNSNRITLSSSDIVRFQKIQIYNNLLKNNFFMERIIRNQWTSKLIIKVKNIQIAFIENIFDYELVIERVIQGDKPTIFPFVKVNRDLIMQSKIQNLQVLAQKQVYNLINKCFLHNLSWDDGADSLFIHNYQFKHKFTPSELIYKLTINQLSYRIPSIWQTVIILQKCEYIFRRSAKLQKQMHITGKRLSIKSQKQGQKQIFIPLSHDNMCLDYSIEMSNNGDKTMTTAIVDVDISLDLQYWKKLFAYFILPQSCYPQFGQLGQLPLITSRMSLQNSFIRILHFNDVVYTFSGDIYFLWIRNRKKHPNLAPLHRELYANGIEDSIYKISLKDINLRKYFAKYYQKQKNQNYRSLSSPITLSIKILNIAKLSQSLQLYNDVLYDYQIQSLHLKLSYLDICFFKEGFKSKQNNEAPEVPQAPQPFLGLIKHQINIQKFSFKAGVSELAVPLLNIHLDGTKLKIEQFSISKTINVELHLSVNYWNMLIGRWEPIVEKLYAILNLKIGTEKYVLIDSTDQILFDFSTQSLKVLLLLFKDIKAQGTLSILKNRQQKQLNSHLSPYVITNRVGLPIVIDSDFTQPFKIHPDQKLHLQTRNQDITQGFAKIIKFQVEGSSEFYQIDLNMTQPIRITILFHGANQEICIRPISSSIMKEIVITGTYVIQNKTSFPLKLTVSSQILEVQSLQKRALKIGSKMVNKQLKLQFLGYQHQVVENYQFQYNDTIGGYQHYVLYQNNHFFNCIVTLKEEVEKTLVVQPVYYFKNLLPIDLLIQFMVQRIGEKCTFSFTLKVSEEKEYYHLGLNEKIDIRVKIKGFNISPFQQFSNPSNPNFEITSIKLVDHRANPGSVKIKIQKDGRVRKAYFYADAIIINQTPYPLYAFTGKQLLPGQRLPDILESESKFILVNEAKMINFGFEQTNAFNSDAFVIMQLGNNALTMYEGLEEYKITVKNTLHCLDDSSKIYCNVLKVSPTYIMVNSTSKIIEVSQVNLILKKTSLGPGQKVSWHWKDKNQPKQIVLKMTRNEIQLEEQFHISQPLTLSELEETVIVLRPIRNKPSKTLLKIQLVKEFERTFITFKQINYEVEDQIFIKNQLKFCKLRVYQSIIDNKMPPWINYRYYDILYNQRESFGWDYPELSHLVTVEITFAGPRRSKFLTEILQLNFDDPQEVIHQIRNHEGQALDIKISVESVGSRKTLKISQKDELGEDEQLRMEIAGSRLGISLKDVGISIISGRKPRRQIIYFNVQKIQIIMMEKKDIRSFQLKVKYVNVDNNTNHNTIYPILVTPLMYEKTLNKSRPFFVVLFEQNIKTKNLIEIKEFRVCLEPISLKIHDEILDNFYAMYKQVNAILREDEKLDLRLLFRSYQKDFDWQQIVVINGKTEVFFHQFEIARLAIQISFSIKPKVNQGNYLISTIISSFGVAISNVSESQLTLSRFQRKGRTLSHLINQMTDFYIKQFMRGIYKVLGSINIVGNPYMFIKLVAEGTWQIFNQPTEGFIKGPVEGAVGIVKGGVYFTRNVVAGSFNSFEAVSESFSRGIAYLTMDEKFIQRRAKIKSQKAKHLFDGIQYGAFSIYTGFEVAMTGLVRHPMEGYQKGGVVGTLTGSLKGISGLVTKPISGIFQGISKFSEGIKNTALLFQDGPNSRRSRPPRVFISEQEYFKIYNYNESSAISLLEQVSTRFLNSQVLFLYIGEDITQNTRYAIILTDKYFIELDLITKKIITEIEIQNLSYQEYHYVNRIIYGKDFHNPTLDQINAFKQFHQSFMKCTKKQF